MVIATTVLVVGAGPAGLLTAAELQRRGVQCLLIDAHERPLEWDRATVVHPRSLEIFDSLGIVEPLLAAGVKQRGARIHADGKVLGEIDLDLCGSRYPYNIGISEEVTESILADYLASHGGSVQRASKLVDLQERPDGMLARIERPDGDIEVLAEWVIGCDGHHSTVRELAGIEQDGHDISQPWAVFDAAISGWPEIFEANYAYLDRIPVILTALARVPAAQRRRFRSGGRCLVHVAALSAPGQFRRRGPPGALPLLHQSRAAIPGRPHPAGRGRRAYLQPGPGPWHE